MRRKIGIVIAIMLMISNLVINVQAIDNEDEILRRLNSEIDENLLSTKYLVTDDMIGRVFPETKVSELKSEWKDKNIKIYEDNTCTKEVTEGNVGTGMALKVDGWQKTYEISVIADMDKDGIANQIELSKIIREVKQVEDRRLQGLDKVSADVTGDGKIDGSDIRSLIDYIVFGRLEVEPIPSVESPKVEVIRGEEKEGYYITDVGVKITEQNAKEKTDKTVYKITGTKEKSVTQIEDGSVVELNEDGIYKISAYTYGKLGNRSMASSVIIKLEKPVAVGYKVEHYKETLDGKYELADTDELNGLSGSTVEATARTYEGFTEDEHNINRVATGTIQKDGSLVLKLYYNRNSYTLTLEKDENIESVTGAGTYKYGAEVEISANLKQEEGYTYSWDKWETKTPELLDDISEQTSKITMPLGNVTLTAKAIKVKNEYNINYVIYEKDNKVDNTENPTKYETGKEIIIKDLTKEPQNTIERENCYIYGKPYIFDGWYTNDRYEGNNITKIESTQTGNITLHAKWAQVVARIVETGKLYTKLQTAIDACEVNGEKRTIEILENIHETGVVPTGKDITIDLNGKLISSDSPEATIKNSGSLQIVDKTEEKLGKVENTASVAIKNDGTFTLGDDDGAVGDMPSVAGENYGIDNSNVFNFYDGNITGTLAIKGEVTKTPEYHNAVVNQEEAKQKATLGVVSNAVARIGSVYYVSLENAIEEAKENEQTTIVMLRTYNLTDTLIIPDNKNIILDLNSNTISMNAVKDAIQNNGTFEITDNSEGKIGEITTTSGDVIVNEANAKFKLTNGTLSARGSYKAAIRNAGIVDVVGGKVATTSARMYGIYNTNNTDEAVNITGGTFTDLANDTRYTYGVYNAGNGKITIDGESVNINVFNSVYNNSTGTVTLKSGTVKNITNNSNLGGNIEVSGGTVESQIRNGSGINNMANLTVTGGTIRVIESSGYADIEDAKVTEISNSGNNMKVKNVHTLTSFNNQNANSEATIENSTINSVGNYGQITIDNSTIRSITTYKTTSNITLNNCNVSGGEYQVINNVGILEINGGTVESSRDQGTAITSSGTLKINDDCTVNSNGVAIYNNSGNITLGKKSTESSKTPVINGGTYGISNPNNDIINFYEGEIRGGTNAIFGKVSDIPEGKKIVFTTENSKEVARIGIDAEYIAKVGDVSYLTLQQAIDNTTEENNMVTILKDFYITADEDLVSVAEGKDIVIDLNGKNIKSYKSGVDIQNFGTLKIDDSLENVGTLTNIFINNANKLEIANGNYTYQLNKIEGITNESTGTIEISGGNITSNGTEIKLVKNSGNLLLTGGKLEILNTASNLYAIYAEEGSSTILDGGTIKTNAGQKCIQYPINSAGTIEIRKGNILATSLGSNVLVANGALTITGGKIENVLIRNNTKEETKISGGSIDGKIENTTTMTISGGTLKNIVNNNNATMNITGGTITNYSSIENLGTMTISGGTMTNGGSINNGRGAQLVITGGTIKNASGDAVVNSGNFVLGEKDEIVSAEIPTITGKGYGVKNNGTFDFYDGIISGKPNAILGAVTNIPDNYEILRTVENEVETAILNSESAVAQVGSNEYMTLQEAIDATTEEDNKITILRNFEVLSSEDSAIVNSGKTVLIDLNGNTLTYQNEYLIKNSGTLEITDSTDDNKGRIYGLKSSGIFNANGSTFILSGGTIEIADNLLDANAIYGEQNSNIIITGLGSINTGYIDSNYRNRYEYLINTEGNVSIQNGELVGKRASVLNVKGIITITGGKIESLDLSSSGEVNISGCEMTSVGVGNTGIMTISGITIDSSGGKSITNSGTMTMTNVDIAKHSSIANSGTMAIEGGTIKEGGTITNGDNNSNSSQLTIISGTIEQAIQNNNSGNLILGKKDRIVDTESPKITGGESGIINNAGGKINFYDGVIKGRNNAISGVINEVEEEYEVLRTEQDGIKTATLIPKDFVAQTGNGNKYKTLQDAINNTTAEDNTVTILRDYEVYGAEQSTIVNAGKTILIDLNGKKITYQNEYLIKNLGTLEITDYTVENNGKIYSLKSSGIYNAGVNSTFTLSGGAIELPSGLSSNMSAIYGEESSNIIIKGSATVSVCSWINNYNKVTYENLINTAGNVQIQGGSLIGQGNYEGNLKINGVLTITGGMINNASLTTAGQTKISGGELTKTSIINSGIMEVAQATIDGNGSKKIENLSVGTITITSGELTKLNEITNNGIMTIEGGTIINVSSFRNNKTLTITGGTIETTSSHAIENTNSGDLTLGASGGIVSTENPKIIGGTYGIVNASGVFNFYDGRITGSTSAINGIITNLENGYRLSRTRVDEKETATLTIIPTDEAVVKIGTINYMDLQTAINSCLAGNETTVTLLKNLTLENNIIIDEGKNVILDIKGMTINNQERYNIINNGTLTLIDSTGGDTALVKEIVINNGTFKVPGELTNNTVNINNMVNTDSVDDLDIMDNNSNTENEPIGYSKMIITYDNVYNCT